MDHVPTARSRALATACCMLCAGLATSYGCAADRATPRTAPEAPTPEEGPAASIDIPGGMRPAWTPPPCSEDNPFCPGSTGEETSITNDCGAESVDLTPTGVNVMIAIDGSISMAPYWQDVRDAVSRLRSQNPDGAYGVHLFFGQPVEDFDALVEKSNLCGMTDNRVLDVDQRTDQELLEFVGDAPPGPAGFFPSSPLVEPINYYLTSATRLADPTRTNYLVVISDGTDNCFGSTFTNPRDKRLALEKVAVELATRNVRLIPIGFVPGQETNMPADAVAEARVEALDTLAKYGGAGIEEAFSAESPQELLDAIDQVGSTVGNCRFTVPAALDPTQALNTFQLTFSINGVEVPRDRLLTDGWNFVGGGTSEVEFHGQACEALRSGSSVQAHKTCSKDVCGTAAVEVETKERLVLYLLDASASRIECTGTDPFGCFWGVGNGADRPEVTFWEVVEHALAQSLVSPVNDDVQFGLQFFPTADLLSCDFVSDPVIDPQHGTAIEIMSKMFERLPFGASPVVAALEGMANSPGRLADPSVSAALVVLTDGGDNCSGLAQADIVDSLGQSAAKLLDAGVSTYVVRFGKPENKTPELEEQLAAIAVNGGTATSDPNDPDQPPYIDAVDASALDLALAEISDRLASCSFGIGGLPDKADKSLANLYLNGELIPFDEADEKTEGWGWADAEQTEIDLYGVACEDFKTNRKTSATVEFGCEQIVVRPPD